jgi:hypothetical protein
MIDVKHDDVAQAYTNWVDATQLHGVDAPHAFNDFWTYLGHRNWLSTAGHYQMHEHEAQRLQKLLGPYYAVIVKAWYLVRDDV